MKTVYGIKARAQCGPGDVSILLKPNPSPLSEVIQPGEDLLIRCHFPDADYDCHSLADLKDVCFERRITLHSEVGRHLIAYCEIVSTLLFGQPGAVVGSHYYRDNSAREWIAKQCGVTPAMPELEDIHLRFSSLLCHKIDQETSNYQLVHVDCVVPDFGCQTTLLAEWQRVSLVN